jgi:hypothetical protein
VQLVHVREELGLALEREVEQVALELVLALRALDHAATEHVEAHELLRGGTLLDPDAP